MYLTHVHVDGFKCLLDFDIALNPAFNIVVGDNETGKSTILDAIGLVLTGTYDRRSVRFGFDPYLFNAGKVKGYFEALRKGENCAPPSILIEAYFNQDAANDEAARLIGTNNSKGEDCPGLVLEISLNNDHTEDLKSYARDETNPDVMPVEYFEVSWRSFAGNSISNRKLPCKAKVIDNTHARAYRGPNRYVAELANEVLTPTHQRDLALAYRRLKHGFAKEPGVVAINAHLETKGNPATAKKLSVQMDMSSRTAWDSAVSPHLDDLPFDCAGKGEQCRVQMRLAIAEADSCHVLLIEEPENHLSHANLCMFLDDVKRDCTSRQVIVTTHSAFVLNKLGIEGLKLLSKNGKIASINALSDETAKYFMKLPGFDTLRLVLAKRSILVEGPSDELILQIAYKKLKGKLPLADGVDVISVGSLAFKRFLEIAKLLALEVHVVTDNDGDVVAVNNKYSDFQPAQAPTVKIHCDPDIACKTLEPQILKVNSLPVLNTILGKTYLDSASLLKYMENNKTECALALFETQQDWETPGYIKDAIG